MADITALVQPIGSDDIIDVVTVDEPDLEVDIAAEKLVGIRKRPFEEDKTSMQQTKALQRRRVVFSDPAKQAAELQRQIEVLRAESIESMKRRVLLETGILVDHTAPTREEAVRKQKANINANCAEIVKLEIQKRALEEDALCEEVKVDGTHKGK